MVKPGERIAVLGLSAETAAGNVGTVVVQGLETESRASRAKAESQLARLEVERDQATKRLAKSEAQLKQVETQISLQMQRVARARADPDCRQENQSPAFALAVWKEPGR